MRSNWLLLALLGCVAVAQTSCQKESAGTVTEPERTEQASRPARPAAATADETTAARDASQATPTKTEQAAVNTDTQRNIVPDTLSLGGLGSCEPSQQVNTTVERLVALADSNADGQVSKVEAQNLANFLLGGFFFRADGNGDGTVTPAEGREARAEFMSKHPLVASVFQRAKGSTGDSPLASLAELLDVEYGKPMTTNDARDAARKVIDDLYRVADGNRDSTLTMVEARTLGVKSMQALGGTLFNTADANKDGQISSDEFKASIERPAQAAFNAADRDNNGELTKQEATIAVRELATQVGWPHAAN